MADDDVPAADHAEVPEPDLASDPPASIARGVVAALILGAAGVAAWLAIAPDFDGAAVVTTATTTSAPSSTVATTILATTTTAVPATAPSETAPPTTDLRALPAGLGCAALTEMGLTYSQVVQYWNGTAQPVELDADADGEPCEQAFSRAVIEAELGEPEPLDTTSTTVAGGTNLPPGLRCADLGARGVSVADAIAYYLAQGSPRRMDADGNGIPCETVYVDAAAAWNDRR